MQELGNDNMHAGQIPFYDLIPGVVESYKLKICHVGLQLHNMIKRCLPMSNAKFSPPLFPLKNILGYMLIVGYRYLLTLLFSFFG